MEAKKYAPGLTLMEAEANLRLYQAPMFGRKGLLTGYVQINESTPEKIVLSFILEYSFPYDFSKFEKLKNGIEKRPENFYGYLKDLVTKTDLKNLPNILEAVNDMEETGISLISLGLRPSERGTASKNSSETVCVFYHGYGQEVSSDKCKEILSGIQERIFS